MNNKTPRGSLLSPFGFRARSAAEGAGRSGAPRFESIESSAVWGATVKTLA